MPPSHFGGGLGLGGVEGGDGGGVESKLGPGEFADDGSLGGRANPGERGGAGGWGGGRGSHLGLNQEVELHRNDKND